jgi:hypothetical protein
MRVNRTLLALLCGALPLSASATQPTSPVSAKPLARAHAGAPAAGAANGIARAKEKSTPRALLGATPGKGVEFPAHALGAPASATPTLPKPTLNRIGTAHRGGAPGGRTPNVAQINGTGLGARGAGPAKIGAGAKGGATINGTAMPGR